MPDIATAPTAPAPKPAPVPTPAPAPSPAPTPTPAAPTPPADNPFAELDAKMKAMDEARSGKPPTPAEPPAPKTEPKATPAPAPQPSGKPMPKELRQEYERLKTEKEARDKAYTELEAKVAAAERRGQDTDALQSRLAAMEKQMQEKDAQLRTYSLEHDPEFQNRFEKPFNDQLEYTRNFVTQLQVSDAEGQSRQATFDDFAELYRMPPAKAIVAATEKFGPAAQLVMNHVAELQRMEYNRGKALKEHQEQVKAGAKEQEERQALARTNMEAAWKKLNKELEDTVENYRSPADDKELEEIRQEGYRVFDSQPATPEGRMVKNAHIRQRVAAFGPNQLAIKRLKSEVERLKAENDELKNPQPGKTRRPSSEQPVSSTETWEEGLRREAAKLGSIS